MYATYTYYSDSYGGGLDEATATPLLERASDIVDTLTFNRIVKITFGNLTTYQQERVQKACCQIADFYHDNADFVAQVLKSYSINGVSMTFGDGSDNISYIGGVCVPNQALTELDKTGLRFRGCV